MEELVVEVPVAEIATGVLGIVVSVILIFSVLVSTVLIIWLVIERRSRHSGKDAVADLPADEAQALFYREIKISGITGHPVRWLMDKFLAEDREWNRLPSSEKCILGFQTSLEGGIMVRIFKYYHTLWNGPVSYSVLQYAAVFSHPEGLFPETAFSHWDYVDASDAGWGCPELKQLFNSLDEKRKASKAL